MDGEHGISYTEFSYMLLQANDYLWLHEHLAARSRSAAPTSGATSPRASTSSAASAARAVARLDLAAAHRRRRHQARQDQRGAVWLDPAKTSPYQFRQLWMQIADDEVAALPAAVLACGRGPRLDESWPQHAEAPERRVAQRALAEELTELVHGPRRPGRPTRPLTCCSAAIRPPRRQAAFEAVGARCPSTAVDRDRARRPGRRCWSAPAWPARTATPGARSRSVGFRANGQSIALDEDVPVPAELLRIGPVPPAPQGQDHATTSWRFLLTEVDGGGCRR